MIRARATDRRSRRAVIVVALVGLVGSLSATVAPVLARDPSPTIRPDRPAWDEPSSVATASASAAGPHQFIVRYRAGTAPVQRRLALAEPGVRHLRDLPGTNLGVVAVAGDTASAVAALEADPRITSVEVDGRSVRFADPHDETFWPYQWDMDNTGQSVEAGHLGAGTPNVDIDLPEALGVTEGSSDVVVAVIDDGVDFSHPDLAGHEWTNPGESGDGKETNGVDDDGNGYIDDVHGWDFCNNDNTVHDFDEDFHGTHVAGTIAASLDGNGVVGIAPAVQVMALKFIDGGPFCGRDSQAIAAINYAKHFGVRLANASWGEYGNPTNHPSLKSAIAGSGMLLVAAAGNDHVNNDAVSTPALPASFNLPNIISVAAIDNRGRMASFSNYGAKTVDIAAPGVAIISALPADADFADPGWGWLSGTSMATPHVTGVAALVLSQAPELRDRHRRASGQDPRERQVRLAHGRQDRDRPATSTPTGLSTSRRPPARRPSSVGFLRGSILGTSTVTGHVVWPAATDDLTGVTSYGVQVQANGGAWATADLIDDRANVRQEHAHRDVLCVPGPSTRRRTQLGRFRGGCARRPDALPADHVARDVRRHLEDLEQQLVVGGVDALRLEGRRQRDIQLHRVGGRGRRAEGPLARLVQVLRRWRAVGHVLHAPLVDAGTGRGRAEDLGHDRRPRDQAGGLGDVGAPAGGRRCVPGDALTVARFRGQLPR